MPSVPESRERGDSSAPIPCTRYPISRFFPADDSVAPTKPNAAERAALRVCADCPLTARRRCLQAALMFPISEQYGVVGNSTAAQRRAILRGRQAERLAGVA
jgi:hypothetical protein